MFSSEMDEQDILNISKRICKWYGYIECLFQSLWIVGESKEIVARNIVIK